MAKLKTLKKLKAFPGKPKKQRELSIEEARLKYDIGSRDLTVAELKERDRVKDFAREATNAGNRQNTTAKNAFKAFSLAEELSPETEIQIDATGYRYDVTHTERIDPDDFLKLFESKKISRETYLQCVSVQVAPATLLIGAHVLKKIKKQVDGKEWDIRTRDLDQPVTGVKVVKAEPPKPGNKLRRDVEQAPAMPGGMKRIKKRRRIKMLR